MYHRNDSNLESEATTSRLRRASRLLPVLVIALAALGLFGSVLAESQPDRTSQSKYSAEKIQEFNNILSGVALRNIPAADNGCVVETYVGGGTPNNCSAGDVRLGEVSNVQIEDDGCAYPGDTVRFTATFVITNNTAAVRRDPGIYFSQDGDSALSGNCSIGMLSTSPSPPYLNDDGDTCGDLSPSAVITETISGIEVLCIDTNDPNIPEDGLLNIPYCTTWQTPNENIQCDDPTGTSAGTSSKCDCVDGGVTIPIEVPGIGMEIQKSPESYDAKPGEVFTYTLTYTNTGNSVPPTPPTPDPDATATNIVVSDTLPSVLKFVGVGSVPGGTVCDDTPDGAYGAVVECTNIPDLIEGASATIELVVMVDPNAVDPASSQNTACVEGTGQGNPTVPGTACDTVDLTTPVTVASFSATSTGSGTRFEWSTSTESANAGFNIYVKTADGYDKVNDKIILTQVVDSSSPQDYVFEASGVNGDTFYIEDVSLFGGIRSHGPYKLNESYGMRIQPEAIDWESIQAEALSVEAQNSAALNAVAAQAAQEALQAQTLTSRVIGLATSLTGGSSARASEAAAFPTFAMEVSQDGIYRLTYEQLKAATTVDLNGVPASQIAVERQGQSVPVYVSNNKFGPGVYLEFYGEALDTLYTDTNVYTLSVDPSGAVQMPVTQARVPRKVQYPNAYMETVRIENNNRYSYLSPTGDPWYDLLMLTTESKSWTFSVPVDNYVAGAGQTEVNVNLWGLSNEVVGPDHRVLVAVNDQQVADSSFDGLEVANIVAMVPANALANGSNQIKLTLPVSSGADYDMVGLEAYGVTYPRAFVATNGSLDFTAEAEAFEVTGLNSNDVVVYRLTGAQPERLTSFRVSQDSSGYKAAFLGGSSASYVVSTAQALLTPEVSVVAPVDITSGTADLLIIAHEQFLTGFGPLVQARKAEGYAVKLVDVDDVYAHYSGGVFDANAIRAYIQHAVTNMGVDYIILGGGDTTDYRNYKGNSGISHIPSLYASTSREIQYAPVDPLYTDVNGDGFPDAALGRFPARTIAELNAMISKTLLYGNNSNSGTAVFAADLGFEGDSESYLREMNRSRWDIDRAYISALGAQQARSTLISSLNEGPRMASFVGHSSEYQWTTSATAPLFTYNDAGSLTNTDPMMISQWGCWNTYYVDPTYSTLGHKFLLSGNKGAAAVAGSTTLTLASSERALGDLMMPLMTEPGVAIGDAMQTAKAQLALTQPELTDVILGWTILGDPTIKVNP